MNISFRWFINLILTLFAPKVLLKRIQFPGVINLIDALRLNLVLGPNLQSLLRYLDRNSMAASIEARVPFLDHVLVEEVLRSSPQDGFVDGKMKSYLRETFKNYLPTAILERRSKLGYTTPETAWLKTINEESPYANNNKIGTLGWRKYILAKWIEMIQKFDSQ
jgi:asparagine synthetase B (glutamine-hydrolysing)